MKLNVQFKTFFVRFVALFVFLFALGLLLAYIFAVEVFPKSPAFGVFIAIILGAPVAVLFAKWSAEHITESIRYLAACARAASQGEKKENVTLRSKDEFTILAEALSGMADRDTAIKDANEDPLTGLSNRRYFMQRLEKALERKKPLAVMFIDLDGFKPINDEYGHDVGDEALRIVADRMSACIRESDVLARFGGDEFVIMFSGLEDEGVLTERADKVLEMVGTPMWISGNRVRMGASIGISMCPKDAQDAESLLNAADESMYAAKQGGKNAYRFYS